MVVGYKVQVGKPPIPKQKEMFSHPNLKAFQFVCSVPAEDRFSEQDFL